MSMQTEVTGWRSFWERGGWWRALLAVVAYFVIYQGVPLLFAPLFPKTTDPAAEVWLFTVLPIAFGGLVLLAFAWSVGWTRELFARQPISGRGWMWIAVAVVLVFNVLRFASIDYTAAGASLVLAWLVAGLCIGFAEEVLTRGLVVNLMRKGGARELVVAVVSAALFALMHSGNLLTGQALFPTLMQLVYTFGFGILMYLALRVTGNLIWPILLHATTDPSIFLATAHPVAGPLPGIAGLGNIVVIIAGIGLLWAIRGSVNGASAAEAPAHMRHARPDGA
ncbi:CPBP family intramembrane glutamic endopeptidase [Leucobacter chromiireducens]|uniref:CPBP family intramembrane glutamic endopeptidase n=1 Tax=Leucobacter chromiireducens TaxID=283877 RepID=UPI000F63D615|nr:CPBP family intramembrane glutamic endopeptidase [Leucobacter chromiireducens]